MTSRRALWLLIGVTTVLRLTWSASLGTYGNEAYYGAYARHLDWGYFDHPPMVGLIAALGEAVVGPRAPVFGLRLGFVLLSCGSTWLLARLTGRLFGARAAWLAALGLNATVFYGLRVGTFAEPDGPLLFFWLLALDRLWVAGELPWRTGVWAQAGAAWGGALLCKYHGVLLPVGAAGFLLVRREQRACLRRPGPYLALGVGLAEFAPVIAWNARHGWASFLYQGSRAGGFEALRPTLLLEALIGQVLYLTPWIWLLLMAILVHLASRGPARWSKAEAFLACQSLPALGLFLGVATFRRIMPHWPMIGFVALFPLLGRLWSHRLAAAPASMRRRLMAVGVAPVVLATLFVVQAHTGWFQDRQGRLLGVIPPASDPTVDTIRWDQIARALKARGLLDDPDTFLFTDHWRFSAALALATRNARPLACYHRDARGFTYWSRPEDWVGRDGLFVRVGQALADADDYAPWFTRVEALPPIGIVRNGVVLEQVRLYRCRRQHSPYAFGYQGPGPIPHPRRPEGPGEKSISVVGRALSPRQVP